MLAKENNGVNLIDPGVDLEKKRHSGCILGDAKVENIFGRQPASFEQKTTVFVPRECALAHCFRFKSFLFTFQTYVD